MFAFRVAPISLQKAFKMDAVYPRRRRPAVVCMYVCRHSSIYRMKSITGHWTFDGGHSGVVPSSHVPARDQLQQLSLGQNSVRNVQARHLVHLYVIESVPYIHT